MKFDCGMLVECSIPPLATYIPMLAALVIPCLFPVEFPFSIHSPFFSDVFWHQNPHPSRALADMAHWATSALRHSFFASHPSRKWAEQHGKNVGKSKKRWWLAHDPPHLRHSKTIVHTILNQTCGYGLPNRLEQPCNGLFSWRFHDPFLE